MMLFFAVAPINAVSITVGTGGAQSIAANLVCRRYGR